MVTVCEFIRANYALHNLPDRANMFEFSTRPLDKL
ncbi:hypothetical protein CGOTT_06890 [Corynebacterium gottingense]|nr:hypothetical protein CGOTT_06890 [Corynebacterium gottingense]WJZ15624.1 hypothetical protein CGOTTB_06900 [Corynebacterium gottingense]WKC60300.1 hypothetical protein CHAD_07165 [Corynebacterium hadale]